MGVEINIEKEKLESDPEKYIDDLITEIKEENFTRIKGLLSVKMKIPFSLSGTQFIARKLEEVGLPPQHILGFLGIISDKAKINYLKTKPTTQIATYMFQKLDKKYIHELAVEIDDDFYITRLLLPISTIKKPEDYFVFRDISDLYLRDKLVRKFAYGYPNFELCQEQLDKYEDIKTRFLALETEYEKTKFLIELEADKDDNESIKDINDIKRFLLQYLREPNNRDSVIESMKSTNSEIMTEYVDLVKKMIFEYLSSQGELTQEMKEKLKIVFKSYSVIVDDLSEVEVRRGLTKGMKEIDADCDSSKRIIRIDKKTSAEKIMSVLIHEYGHALSREFSTIEPKDFMKRVSNSAGDLEEGIVEVFKHNVIEYYLRSRESISINSNEIRRGTLLIGAAPTDNYREFYNIIQTLLAPLEKAGRDVEALKEYLLGDSEEFYKNIDAEFLLINPDKNIVLSLELRKQLYEKMLGRIFEISTNSTYLEENDLLKSFWLINRVAENNSELQDRLFLLNDSIDRVYRENSADIPISDINGNIFEKGKLYEIPQVEFEFVCNAIANKNMEGTMSYYVKDIQLSDDEIEVHSTDIIKNLITYYALDCWQVDNTYMLFSQKINEKAFECEARKAIENEKDLRSQIELYKILTQKDENLKKVKNKIPQIDGFRERTIKKIEEGLSNPKLSTVTYKKFAVEELADYPELGAILREHGLIEDKVEDKTYNDLLGAVKNFNMTVSEVEETAGEIIAQEKVEKGER